MLTLIDRQLIYSYVKAYIVCLVSLLALFIVVDLFTNLDMFAVEDKGLWEFLVTVAKYYGVKIAQIFDRLCEAIVLMAAMFTVAWMQRNNEMLPLLSAGVSTRRIVRPVLLAACLMVGLTVLNQELVLPRVDAYLAESRGDVAGKRELGVQGAYESNGTLVTGNVAYRNTMTVKGFLCVFAAKIGRDSPTFLQAKEARYIPPGEGGSRSGGWLLTETVPPEILNWTRPDLLENITPGTYFLKTQEMDFEAITRPRMWYMYYSTLSLLRELGRTHNSQVASVAVVFHMRLTRPILGMLLVFMGLSTILRDQNRNIFISAGTCVGLCALFFMAIFFCKHFGDNEVFSPALAAWLPVMVFGPLSFVMFDAVHT